MRELRCSNRESVGLAECTHRYVFRHGRADSRDDAHSCYGVLQIHGGFKPKLPPQRGAGQRADRLSRFVTDARDCKIRFAQILGSRE